MITPLAAPSVPPGTDPPLGFWGGYRPPYTDIGGPGPQPPAGAHPSHPIWRPDLGFWGGSKPPYMDIGGPAPQPPPLVIWGPGDPRPTNPIAGPGRPPHWGIAQDPGYGIEEGGGKPPLGFWGPNDPRPTPPIAEPPWGWGNPAPPINLPPDPIPEVEVEWKYGWTVTTGWIVIGIPTSPVPTPSKK